MVEYSPMICDRASVQCTLKPNLAPNAHRSARNVEQRRHSTQHTARSTQHIARSPQPTAHSPKPKAHTAHTAHTHRTHHIGTAHSHSTRIQHTVTAHGYSTRISVQRKCCNTDHRSQIVDHTMRHDGRAAVTAVRHGANCRVDGREQGVTDQRDVEDSQCVDIYRKPVWGSDGHCARTAVSVSATRLPAAAGSELPTSADTASETSPIPVPAEL